jgi:hypothetical protein
VSLRERAPSRCGGTWPAWRGSMLRNARRRRRQRNGMRAARLVRAARRGPNGPPQNQRRASRPNDRPTTPLPAAMARRQDTRRRWPNSRDRLAEAMQATLIRARPFQSGQRQRDLNADRRRRLIRRSSTERVHCRSAALRSSTAQRRTTRSASAPTNGLPGLIGSVSVSPALFAIILVTASARQ